MLAQDADEVMKPLTRYDDSRTVKGVFHAMSPGGNYGFGWGVEVVRVRSDPSCRDMRSGAVNRSV